MAGILTVAALVLALQGLVLAWMGVIYYPVWFGFAAFFEVAAIYVDMPREGR